VIESLGTLPEPPHPLVAALAASLPAGARVLVLGLGSGRHLPVLRAAGLLVDAVEADPARASAALRRCAGEPGVRIARAAYRGPLPFATGFEGALATHALLHGQPAEVGAALNAVANRLRPGARFYFTLGSSEDPRYGRGAQLGPLTWAAGDGPEAGVAHSYFDPAAARALLAAWHVESLELQRAAQTAGRWAHAPAEAEELLHWFVRARRAEF
jgi:SAM-dependent methyltransferase